MVAYVYLIEEVPHQAGESGPWTKIGCSKNDPEWRRERNLAYGNSRQLRIAAVYAFESEKVAYEVEHRAHNQFQQFQHEREWFRVAWQQVANWFHESGIPKL